MQRPPPSPRTLFDHRFNAAQPEAPPAPAGHPVQTRPEDLLAKQRRELNDEITDRGFIRDFEQMSLGNGPGRRE